MANHLIFSRNPNNSPLSAERIAQLAPAVYSTTKADHLTNRYVSLSTSEIIPVLQDYGYQPMQAAQRKSRKAMSGEHAGHMLAFAKPQWNEDDMIRPEIILYNSHDGSGSVKLFAGAFRFICSNGIVAGDGFQSRIYHSRALNGFEEMLKSTINSLPNLMERIEKLRSTTLTYTQSRDMAVAAVATRWNDYTGQERGTYAVARTVQDALNVVRDEDDYQDAWTVFNRIQEAVIRGKTMIRSITEAVPEGMLRKARPVNSVKESIRINGELWNIADKIVEEATA